MASPPRGREEHQLPLGDVQRLRVVSEIKLAARDEAEVLPEGRQLGSRTMHPADCDLRAMMGRKGLAGVEAAEKNRACLEVGLVET